MHFIEKCSHFVNLKKKIETYKPSHKCQRLFILTFVIKETLNEQRIIILSNVEFITSIKSLNRLSLTNISLLIINRLYKSHFVVIIMRVFMTFIKFITSIVKPIVASPLLIFLKFIKIKIMRKHLKYKII